MKAVCRFVAAVAMAFVVSAWSIEPIAEQIESLQVRGRVIDYTTAEAPVARARIVLYSLTDPALMFAGVSAADGTFQFDAIPLGRYGLRASKPGWLDAVYGSRRVGLPGRPLVVTGQGLGDLVLQMARGGVIEGLILGEDGQPLPGAEVRVLRYVEGVGVDSGVSVGSSASRVTDDRGAYRVYGLPPGEFVVAVWPARIGFDTGAAPRRLAESDFLNPAVPAARPKALGRFEYAPVFYPSATDIAAAVPIKLGAGDSRTSVDLRARFVGVVTLRGVLGTAEGLPLAGANVTLASELGIKGIEGIRTASVSPLGEFVFPSVAPGRYSLRARVLPERSQGTQLRPGDLSAARYGAASVIVGQDDIVVNLGLSSGGVVAGTIVPPSGISKVDWASASVRLLPVDSSMTAPVTVPNGAGRFQMSGVPPGQYRVLAAPPLAVATDWFLLSASVQGKDLTEGELDVALGGRVEDLVITFTQEPTEVRGQLFTPAGAPATEYLVVAFPVDRALWGKSPSRLSQAKPNSAGRFAIRGLPPGEYHLAVVAALDELDTLPPALLEELVQGGVKIVLGAGQHVTQDLKIIGLPWLIPKQEELRSPIRGRGTEEQANAGGVLLATLGQSALRGAVVGVLRGVDDAHRGFAALLLEDVGGEARHAGDDQQRIGDFRCEAQVAADRRDGAVDVDRQRAVLQRRVVHERVVDGAQHARVGVIHLELVGDLQQTGRARIDRVIAVAESRRRNVPRLHQAFDQGVGRLGHGRPALRERQSLVEQRAAGEGVAAVEAAETEHAGRHGSANRRAGRRRVPRGQRGRWCRAVIHEGYEHRVDEPADRWRREFARQQQIRGIAESDPAHQIVETIAAHEDLVGVDRGQARGPGRLGLPGAALRRCHRAGLRNRRGPEG